MMKNGTTACLLALPALLASTAAQAAVIGIDRFDYPDGSIYSRSGGTGWAYERTNEPTAPAQAASDWDPQFGGAPMVVSSSLVTNGSSAYRGFGGPGEGSGASSGEREGAFRAEGRVFFSINYQIEAMMPAGTAQWGGVSSMDFGAERILFGIPTQSTEIRYFGMDFYGGAAGYTLSTIPVVAGVNYLIVASVDFENDRISMWINPDSNDTASSYDVSAVYTNTNWSTGVRVGSSPGTNVTIDNVIVADSFTDAVPEPSAAALGMIGALALLRRRRD